MSLIEDKECFKNCTKLCKPHESNKAMWKIYNNNSEHEKEKLLKNQKEIRKSLKHPDFI